MKIFPRSGGMRPSCMSGRSPGKAKSLADGKFPASMLGLTPQGWLRAWDGDGRVHTGAWPEALPCPGKSERRRAQY